MSWDQIENIYVSLVFILPKLQGFENCHFDQFAIINIRFFMLSTGTIFLIWLKNWSKLNWAMPVIVVITLAYAKYVNFNYCTLNIMWKLCHFLKVSSILKVLLSSIDFKVHLELSGRCLDMINFDQRGKNRHKLSISKKFQAWFICSAAAPPAGAFLIVIPLF